MSDKKIVIVYGESYWEGLYIDGELKYQNHEIQAEDLIRLLGLEVEYVRSDDKWLYEHGRLPEKLEDVVRDETD